MQYFKPNTENANADVKYLHYKHQPKTIFVINIDPKTKQIQMIPQHFHKGEYDRFFCISSPWSPSNETIKRKPSPNGDRYEWTLLANTLTQNIAEWKLRDTFEGNRHS